MDRYTSLILGVAIALLAVTNLQATDIFWLGGTGTLLDANYSDGTNTGLAPLPGDVVNFGNGGSATYSGSGFAVGKLRVGHNQTTPAPGGAGQGTVTLNAGTFVELTGGAAGAVNAALWVGNEQDGVLNIEDNANLTLNRLAVIGIGNDTTHTATLNIKTGGMLYVNDGNLTLSDRNGSSGSGVPAVLNLSDSSSQIKILGPGADLVLANREAEATYTQTDGTVEINDSVDIAPQSGSSTGTSFSISGGTLTSGTSNGATAGNFFVGRGSSTGATVNISGTAVVNVGNRFLMGGSNGSSTAIATGVVTNHSGGTLSTDVDVRVADTFISPTSDATYNLSGTGVLNSTTGGVIGRQGTGRFIQTGGTANFNGALSIGNREAASNTTATGLYKISAGAMNVQTALNVAPKGTGEFRVVGDDATIDITGDLSVNNTVDGIGKLAFEFETGDLLSQITVTGAATFALGTSITLDTTNASPTQTSYNLLTAVSIVDSGLNFTGPSGWGFEIIDGGNGKILRAAQGLSPALLGDFNNDNTVDASDYATWRKNEVPNASLPNDNDATSQVDRFALWRANFGKPPGSGSSLGGAQVPEPATLLLVLIGMSAIPSGRRRS